MKRRYLRIIPVRKNYAGDDVWGKQQATWDIHGMVGHAMSSKRAMTEKEICWEYTKYEAQEYYESELKNIKPEHIHAYMIRVETTIKKGLAALIKIGLAKEL